MNEHIRKLQDSIAPLRQEIIQHQVYSAIRTPADLRIFMRYHVYAVWDFMSLLKTLQRQLTCTTVPWFPVGDADTRFLINEIVVGEESDVDPDGKRMSHFELYLAAMRQCGCETQEIDTFLRSVKNTGDLSESFAAAGTPKAAAAFVNYTFKVIGERDAAVQSAIFTFGREDLIPDMFLSIIQEIHRNFPGEIALFKYYIERHIEVDGGHHSQLALDMTSNLCGDDPDKWERAQSAVEASLRYRHALWDGVHEELLRRTS